MPLLPYLSRILSPRAHLRLVGYALFDFAGMPRPRSASLLDPARIRIVLCSGGALLLAWATVRTLAPERTPEPGWLAVAFAVSVILALGFLRDWGLGYGMLVAVGVVLSGLTGMGLAPAMFLATLLFTLGLAPGAGPLVSVSTSVVLGAVLGLDASLSLGVFHVWGGAGGWLASLVVLLAGIAAILAVVFFAGSLAVVLHLQGWAFRREGTEWLAALALLVVLGAAAGGGCRLMTLLGLPHFEGVGFGGGGFGGGGFGGVGFGGGGFGGGGFGGLGDLELLAWAFLFHTRLPLYPLEAAVGYLAWRRGIAGCWNADRISRRMRRAFFDRHTWMPLPGESASLMRLARVDWNRGVDAAIRLAQGTQHQVAAAAALRRFMARDPFGVQVRLERFLVDLPYLRDRLLRAATSAQPDPVRRARRGYLALARFSRSLTGGAFTGGALTYGARWPREHRGPRSQLRHALELFRRRRERHLGAGGAPSFAPADVADGLDRPLQTLEVASRLAGVEEFRYGDRFLAVFRTFRGMLRASRLADVARVEVPRLPSRDSPQLFPPALDRHFQVLQRFQRVVERYGEAANREQRQRVLLALDQVLMDLLGNEADFGVADFGVADFGVADFGVPYEPFPRLVAAHLRTLVVQAVEAEDPGLAGEDDASRSGGASSRRDRQSEASKP